jgi:hypothetical protein
LLCRTTTSRSYIDARNASQKKSKLAEKGNQPTKFKDQKRKQLISDRQYICCKQNAIDVCLGVAKSKSVRLQHMQSNKAKHTEQSPKDKLLGCSGAFACKRQQANYS